MSVSRQFSPALSRFIRQSPIQRTPIAYAVADAAAGLPAGTRVLDAGAGEAPYRELFIRCAYTTHDWPGTMHEGARAADILADIHELPIDDGSFDFVLLTEVLEHVAEPQRALTELRRVLAPGGTLLLTVPFVGELHEEPHDHYRYTSYGLSGLLQRAGFDAVAVRPLTGWYSTLAHVMRHSGLATARPGMTGRSVSFAFLCASGILQRLAPVLDRRLDARRALPLGWVAQGHRG